MKNIDMLTNAGKENHHNCSYYQRMRITPSNSSLLIPFSSLVMLKYKRSKLVILCPGWIPEENNKCKCGWRDIQ